MTAIEHTEDSPRAGSRLSRFRRTRRAATSQAVYDRREAGVGGAAFRFSRSRFFRLRSCAQRTFGLDPRPMWRRL